MTSNTPGSFLRACAGIPLLLFIGAACQAPAESARPLAQPGEVGFDAARLERVVELVRGSVERGEHAGASVLVMRHGRTVLDQSFGLRDVGTGAPMQRDTIVRMYSMTKVITCVAVLQLVEDGRLQIDAPIARWLPELADVKVLTGGTADAPELVPLATPLTVKHLLNHTAGFTYDLFGNSPVNELYRRADLWNSTSLDEFMAKVGQLPLLAQPGTGFHYGISDDVLGVLIQRVSGLEFEDWVARNITEPLGMHDTAFDVPADKMGRLSQLHGHKDGKLTTTPVILGAYAEPGRGIPSGGGGIFSTIGDYARFAQCLLDGGSLDGRRILGRKTVELALMNSLPPGVHAFGTSEGWGLFSGLRLDVAQSGEPGSAGTFYWSGAATTTFFADPREDLVALVVCQHLPFDEQNLFARFRTAVYQALE